MTGRNGITPWWLFLESRILPNGSAVTDSAKKQEYANRLSVHDRDYHRVQLRLRSSGTHDVSALRPVRALNPNMRAQRQPSRT